ncbi:sensory box histidine kinase/response regulator [Minicystis rosea]|nr:sensory box histidine kinase/response regulator [Minicystis rosea]
MEQTEQRRLRALYRYDILDTPSDGAFDRITAIAARTFGVPMAIVSLVDHDRIWFKSHRGVDVDQIPREPGLCASAILSNDVYVVTDAAIDPRTLTNSLVAGSFGLRFYAAAPLLTHDGHRLGTLCVLDRSPREVSEGEAALLVDLAAIVMDEMELRLSARRLADVESRLRLAQQLETVGQLASGVAHEFNNLLTAIQTSAEVASMAARIGGDVRLPVDNIVHACERGARLTRQMLKLSRTPQSENALVDLNQVVAQIEPMLRNVIGTERSLDLRCQMGLPLALGDAATLEQVLLNLVLNARDATRPGGVIRIETNTVQIGVKDARPDVPSGSYACIHISDDGVGMSAETLRRAFEPFFTTKEVGKGTGLGLSVSYGIARQHGGFLDATSEMGRGTTFTFGLPIAVAATRQRLVVPPRGASTRARVLLVDDDPDVRSAISLLLRSDGYDVHESATAVDALGMWERENGRFDLILTDVVMPGKINGLELAAEVRRRAPRTPVLVMSGFTAQTNDEFPTLWKPIAPSSLRELIDGALQSNTTTIMR